MYKSGNIYFIDSYYIFTLFTSLLYFINKFAYSVHYCSNYFLFTITNVFICNFVNKSRIKTVLPKPTCILKITE
jgi:hypothetical protein